MIRAVLSLLALASPIAAEAASRQLPARHADHVSDWSKIVALTSDGGIRMGNPSAKVKVVEFFSYTCPHCAVFASEGTEPLAQKYVRGGQVSYEIRPALRDALDLTVALAARCVPAPHYFAWVEAIMGTQQVWIPKAGDYVNANRDALNGPGKIRAIHALLTNVGIEATLVKQGMAPAALDKCLDDKAAEDALQKTTNDAWNVRHIDGTPSFFINDTAQPDVHGWAQLEPAIKTALKG